jgi:hypothetical protein
MTKTNIQLYLDYEAIKKLREQQINLSATVNEFILKIVESPEDSEIHALITRLSKLQNENRDLRRLLKEERG